MERIKLEDSSLKLIIKIKLLRNHKRGIIKAILITNSIMTLP